MKNDKILYVSDLDGTLLRSDEKTSEFTNKTINKLVEKGMMFSYATARSYNTAHKVTQGLNAKIPLIVYNGALVIDNQTGNIILSNYFNTNDIKGILDTLTREGIYPIVYAFINGVEKFSFVERLNKEEIQTFLDTRKGDKRTNALDDVKDLYNGDIFYVTCIGEKDKLEPFYHKYKNQYHCVFQEDIYLHNQWLEIMPLTASKAHAIEELKEYLDCNHLIVFGDGINDIDMFEIADESYAVSNAVKELKDKATDIIDSNNDDGVAKWLSKNIKS